MGEPFGDFEQLRQIPILTIAHHLGLQVKIGNKVSCPNKSGHSNGDRNPSVSIFPSTNSFRCWVCDHIKGDTIKFAQVFGNLAPDDWKGTAALLNECAGLPAPELSCAPLPKKITHLLPEHIEGMNALMRMSTLPDKDCQRYLLSRRIDPDIAARAGVRCLTGTREIASKLVERFGKDHPALEVLLNGKGNLRFSYHRMLFPYLTREHQVLYIQGRDPTGKAAIKELASSTTPSIPWMPAGRIRPGLVFICEGVIDALTLLSKGYSAIAIPGARTWKPEWASFLEDRDIVSCLDGDLAGDSGTKDINDSLQFIHSFSIAKLPAKKDINDLANEDCLDAFLAPILAAA
jgi:hypothetical protein